MLSLFRKKRTGGLRAGIAAAEHAVALAVVLRRPGGRPLLTKCGLHGIAEGDSGEAYAQAIQAAQLTRTPVSAVIDVNDYQLMHVEAPDVLPAELRAAIRWRLRDVLEYPIEETTIDVMEIPGRLPAARSKMLYAVTARSAAVQRIGTAVARHAPGFDVIDLPEMCLRNITSLLPQDGKGMALMMLRDTLAQVVLTRQGIFYLGRRIELRHGSVEIFGDSAENESEMDAGSLALELQRSLDYYESHYDQPAVGELMLAPDNERVRGLSAQLRDESGLRVNILDIASVMDLAEGVSAPTDWLTLTAVGAALRDDAEAG